MKINCFRKKRSRTSRGCVAESGPHVQLMLNETKKRKKTDFLGARTSSELGRRELERERRETPHSLYHLRRSGGQNPSSQDL